MARLFGTDGVRGVAGRDITAELAVDLASAAAHVLGMTGAFADHRPSALVGTDSRISGGYLAAAVCAGLASAGLDVIDIGVLPTPGLAYLTATEDVDLGVMLSASHNPMPDNGIKFFARGGFKLPDQVEDSIEDMLGKPWDRPTGEGVGRVRTDHLAVLAYADHLVATAPGKLDGLKVVLDCANGAASEVGPEAFRTLGAEVVVTAAAPNGLNINDGVGSTHPEALQAAVVAEGADLGFAFDGDADRCLAVDHAGALVSGDAIMGVLALALRARGALERDTLVTTVMSNIGLHKAMAERGIETVVTDVGDRLGGEQSGHIAGVGFDLYLRMIADAVGEFKGDGPAEPAEVTIELPVDAHIPHAYIDGDRLRLEAYTKLASVTAPEQLIAIREELIDRYGPIPQVVESLFHIARLRLTARAAGVEEIGAQGKFIRFFPVELPESAQLKLKRVHRGAVIKPAVRSVLVPVPREAKIGGAALRDVEVIDWAERLIEDILVPGAVAAGSVPAERPAPDGAPQPAKRDSRSP